MSEAGRAMTPALSIRRARPDEASLLTEVAHAAKRHWGYPDGWMAEWRDALTITPDAVADLRPFVAERSDAAGRGEVLGFHALSVDGRTAVLEHLWVRPASIGAGVGRALLEHAAERARAAGAAALRIDADPHAEGFYLRMGARRVGDVPAHVGGTVRRLPRLVLTLRPSPPARTRAAGIAIGPDTTRLMHIVIGATGHVGSAVAHALLDRGEPVTAVTRDRRRAEPLLRRGAEVAVADVRDPDALGGVLRRGRTAFLLMPPADPAADTVAGERATVAGIVGGVRRAVERAGAGLEKVVVQSTYGAQPGEGIGDLGVLHELEQGVAALGVPASVVRGAFYMSNWDGALETARDDGVVHTFFPPDFALPMVAPADLGRVAARLLTGDLAHTGVCHVEGPTAYSSADVARAAAAALGRDVRVVAAPRSGWVDALRAVGFSSAAAGSYARMLAITLDGAYERPDAPERGPTSLAAYVDARVRGR